MRRLQLLVLGALALAQRGVSAGRSRHLLASNSSGYDDDHHDDHGDDHHGDDDHGGGHGCHDSHAGHHGKYAHFKGMLRCFGFALSIICGIIIGPHVLEIINHTYDPTASVLILVGEVGLCMHAIEAGLMFDPEMMEVVGPRGASRCRTSSTASPTSPSGAGSGTRSPVVTNFVTVGVIGAAGVYVVPHVIEARVTPMIPEEYRQNFLLGLLFVLALGLMCACKFSGSSALLGALLAGVSLCTNHDVHHAWDKQVKRVYAFLMKIFFAATVGFHVPLAELFQTGTLAKAALLLPVILAKLAMGFFAKPLTKLNFWTLAFAWGEWGEFSFLITTLALRSKGKGILHQQAYDAVLFVVLLSILLCPYGLRVTLDYVEQHAGQHKSAKFPTSKAPSSAGFHSQHAALDIAEAILDTAGADGEAAPAYYCIQTLSKARWDQQTAILSTVTSSDCDIVDVRSWHPKDHVGAADVVTELYVKDTSLCLPVVATLADDDQAKLDARVELLHDRVLAALHDSTGEVRIQRWLRGARQNDEGELSPTASAQELLRETRDARAFTAPVTADEDVEADARGHQRVSLQAQLGFTRPTHPPPGGGGGDAAAPPAAPLRQRTHKRQRAKSMIASLESTSCYRDPLDYHELDGFIHTDAHVAFEEQLAPYHQVRRQSSSMDAEALRLIEVPVDAPPEPPEPLVKQSSSPSALGAAAAAAAPPPPGLAAADGGFETAAAPYSRLSSIESDGGSARRSSFSSEQGCVLPTRLRRRSSSGKNVELQDRA
ncbi:sodium/hydrogen exchanger family-like protein [Aureococcus anophagefferens]|nr:sodium/hydrogen exchanger family-like protein [Aureococcus anophagefferens]